MTWVFGYLAGLVIGVTIGYIVGISGSKRFRR